jgi:hypothetical protein
MKYLGANLPNENLVLFETNSQSLFTVHVLFIILYLLKAGLVNSCCHWGLEAAHTVLQMPGGAAVGSPSQQLETHLPTALVQFVDPTWMFVPFLQTILAWENTHIVLEKPLPRLP